MASTPPPGWQALIETMLDAVWLVEPAGLHIVAANRAAGVLAGVPAGTLVGKSVLDFAPTPEDLCFWDEVAEASADSDLGIESESLVRRVDGGCTPVLRRVSRLARMPPVGVDADAGPLYVVTLHDRSEALRVGRELAGAVADLQATLESTHDGILVTDLSGRIRNFNRRFAELWELPDELVGERNDGAVLDWMRRSVTDPATYVRRLAQIDNSALLQASDEIGLVSGRVFERKSTPQCAGGLPIGRVHAFRDITERLLAEQRIEVLSFTDALTGLPNRRLLADRAELALAMAQRAGTPFAVLLLNLDRFAAINESLGRAPGDRVLLEAAERIKGCVRQVDTVARLGADEFVLLIHQADEAGAQITAERIGAAFTRPFTQGGMSFTVTASLGIALYPNDGSGLDDLVRCADAAMREAKSAGRAGFRFYRPRPAPTDAGGRSVMRLDHAMRQGLALGRMRLHYQPQIDIASGRVIGAEALLRWRDPELGEVSPGEFIPVAEVSGFIVPIGTWVLREAVAQAAAWQAAGRAMAVSVNVSALQFQQPDFVEGVAGALRDAGLPAQWLELELTESLLIQDAPEAMLRLQALAQLGVRLAIDDFGIGYSNLSYLKRFPIGRLKIDRSFVAGLPGDESDAAIVQAIVNMGRALRLQIVAEGVENDTQRAFLREIGCDHYQGFLFARALDVPGFEALLGWSAD
ncbi:MAG TPA: EAL domain-containing protein [Burkholderiaceae bacterium]|nr:EAL domain-containing protein [Burkholderiaceae bacterium]